MRSGPGNEQTQQTKGNEMSEKNSKRRTIVLNVEIVIASVRIGDKSYTLNEWLKLDTR